MITCPVCKNNAAGRPAKGPRGGKTTVLESRKEADQFTVAGKVMRAFTMMRRRECLSCGRRWKTIEVLVPGSENGFGRTT